MINSKSDFALEFIAAQHDGNIGSNLMYASVYGHTNFAGGGNSAVHYAPRIKSGFVFSQTMGTIYWDRKSNIDLGFIDIALNDGGVDIVQIGPFSTPFEFDWFDFFEHAELVTITIDRVRLDGSLDRFAIAQSSDFHLIDTNTLRFNLISTSDKQLDEAINQFYDSPARLEGQPKPIYWGVGCIGPDASTALNNYIIVPTLLVDDTSLRYDVTDLDLITFSTPGNYEVLDNGVVLDELADFEIIDNGFELNSQPAGKITFQWLQALPGDLEIAGVDDPQDNGNQLLGPFRTVREILTRVGLSFILPPEADFDDINIGNGILTFPIVYYSDIVSARDAIDNIISQSGGYWYVDKNNDMQVGRLNPPEVETPEFFYDDNNTIGDIKVRIDLAPGLSSKIQRQVRFGVYNAQDLAGSVTGVHKNRLTTEFEIAETTEPIPNVYAIATSRDAMPLWTSGDAPAQDEIDRRWSDLYYRRRNFYTWSVAIKDVLDVPELGAIASLQSDRYRFLNTAVPLVVTEVKADYLAGTITLEGWG